MIQSVNAQRNGAYGLDIAVAFSDDIQTPYPAQFNFFHSHIRFHIDDWRPLLGLASPNVTLEQDTKRVGFLYGKTNFPAGLFARRVEFFNHLRAFFTDWDFANRGTRAMAITPFSILTL
jgi:hypothetical protein